MKVDSEDTISTLHRLRKGNGEVVVEKEKEEERTESLVSDYFKHSSIEKVRRVVDEMRVKWIARRMDMITRETKERLIGMGVEYRVDKKAVEKKPSTKSPEEVKQLLAQEQLYMELLLIYEVRGWEQLFWDKFKAFLDQIGKYRVEEKERLTREWKANCWKRLNPQRLAALKRMADVDDIENKEFIGKQWAKSISQLFEEVITPYAISLSNLSKQIGDIDEEEIRLRMEKEFEDTKFRRGCDSERFDQFWNDNTLFDCRYSRSKWLDFFQPFSFAHDVPLEVYSHALKRNKNIIHISFTQLQSDIDIKRFMCDYPWVTSISPPRRMRPIRRDLFIESNDLNTFAKEITLDPSTYIFSDARNSALSSGKLGRMQNF